MTGDRDYREYADSLRAGWSEDAVDLNRKAGESFDAQRTGDRVAEIIHLSDPTRGLSYCGAPVTVVESHLDIRPVCQECHRGAMKSVREGWCPCVSNRPQDCKPEQWPFSVRHGLLAEVAVLRGRLAAVEALHQPDTIDAWKNGWVPLTVCAHDGRDWPCSTRAALATGEGEDNAE